MRVYEGTGTLMHELDLTWSPFNLFKQTEIEIRLEDALLLTAFDPKKPASKRWS